MNATYNELWKKLIDLGMSKTEMRIRAGISTSSLAKLTKGENVTTAILEKICLALDCELRDILPSNALRHIKTRKAHAVKRRNALQAVDKKGKNEKFS